MNLRSKNYKTDLEKLDVNNCNCKSIKSDELPIHLMICHAGLRFLKTDFTQYIFSPVSKESTPKYTWPSYNEQSLQTGKQTSPGRQKS